MNCASEGVVGGASVWVGGGAKARVGVSSARGRSRAAACAHHRLVEVAGAVCERARLGIGAHAVGKKFVALPDQRGDEQAPAQQRDVELAPRRRADGLAGLLLAREEEVRHRAQHEQDERRRHGPRRHRQARAVRRHRRCAARRARRARPHQPHLGDDNDDEDGQHEDELDHRVQLRRRICPQPLHAAHGLRGAAAQARWRCGGRARELWGGRHRGNRAQRSTRKRTCVPMLLKPSPTALAALPASKPAAALASGLRERGGAARGKREPGVAHTGKGKTHAKNHAAKLTPWRRPQGSPGQLQRRQMARTTSRTMDVEACAPFRNAARKRKTNENSAKNKRSHFLGVQRLHTSYGSATGARFHASRRAAADPLRIFVSPFPPRGRNPLPVAAGAGRRSRQQTPNRLLAPRLRGRQPARAAARAWRTPPPRCARKCAPAG
jgi:hypothetical protein